MAAALNWWTRRTAARGGFPAGMLTGGAPVMGAQRQRQVTRTGGRARLLAALAGGLLVLGVAVAQERPELPPSDLSATTNTRPEPPAAAPRPKPRPPAAPTPRTQP